MKKIFLIQTAGYDESEVMAGFFDEDKANRICDRINEKSHNVHYQVISVAVNPDQIEFRTGLFKDDIIEITEED